LKHKECRLVKSLKVGHMIGYTKDD
jgi:hypothetical protein